MPAGIYTRDVKRVRDDFKPICRDKRIHECHQLKSANESRIAEGDNSIRIFKDFDSGRFNMMVGLEFATITYCPFCGRKVGR
jgi:hypothetical protein